MAAPVAIPGRLEALCENALAYPGAHWEDLPHILDACDVFVPQPIPAIFWILLVSVSFAAIAVILNWVAVTKRATLDAINQLEEAEIYRPARRVFHHYTANDPRALAILATTDRRNDRRAVVDYLNFFETLGGGAAERILSRRYLIRLLEENFRIAWSSGLFLIYQLRFERDPETRHLMRDDNGNPKYDPDIWIEFEKLVHHAVMLPKELRLPSKGNGNWSLTRDDLRKLTGPLRIQTPNVHNSITNEAFDELLDGLAKLTYPLDPAPMAEIGQATAYQPNTEDASNVVLPHPPRDEETDLHKIASTLNESIAELKSIKEAIGALPAPRRRGDFSARQSGLG